MGLRKIRFWPSHCQTNKDSNCFTSINYLIPLRPEELEVAAADAALEKAEPPSAPSVFEDEEELLFDLEPLRWR